MNNKAEITEPDVKESGLYVSGIVVSSTARAFSRKDGSGIAVSLRHEIAYEGGLLAVEEFADPKEDNRVTVNGLQVVTFPQLKTFEPVRFRIEKWKVFNNQLVATRAVRIA